MKNILHYLKDYKKEIVLGPLFKLLEASFELFIPIIMAQIIDIGISTSDESYIIKKCLLMALLGIIGLACSLTAQFFAAKAAVGYSSKLRSALFEHIQNLAYQDLDNIGISSLMTRMTSDINQLQTGCNLVIRLFLRSPFIVFGAMFMAFRINVKAAIVFAVAIPILAIVVYGIMLVSIPLYKNVQKWLDKVTLQVRENLAGVRVIRALSYEDDEISDFDETTVNLSKVQLFVGRISSIMNPVTYAIINLSIVVIIRQGAIQVDQGIITTGEVVALVNYMSQILVELVKLANLIVTVNKAVACGNRVSEVLDIQTSMDRNAEGKILEYVDSIELDNVGLTYSKAAEESLSDVSFKINAGETIGIIGGTGSGKTSLIHLIPRYYDASRGSVKLNGIDIKDYSLKDVRKSICTVPQKSVLFKGTIRENMHFVKEGISDEVIIDALKKSKAYEFVSKKEGVLDYMIEAGGKNLSGGQRQRLAIARALISDASVLIFDDSMSALDYATDASLRAELSKVTDKIKIIVASRVASLGSADRIIVLDDGEISGIGTHQELIESNEVYQEIYNSQIKND